jgi:hypothetical protein
MGVEIKPRLFRLTWPEGHGLHGVTMDVASLSFGQLLKLSRAYRTYRDIASKTIDEQLEAVGSLLDIFAGALWGWNVERDGEPVKPDRAGVESLDPLYVLDAIGAWAGRLGVVDGPLGQRSIPTPSPTAPTIPMETLPESSPDAQAS